jgi:CheY-like chemotaxis protein
MKSLKDSFINKMFRKNVMKNNKKVLIIEDEIIIAEDIQMIMEDLGYNQTEIIMYAEKALEKINEYNPDLILMDIFLKGKMSGIEAAKEIRNNYSIPIIFITAYSDTKSKKEISETTPYGYLIKPIKEEELKMTVEITEYKYKIEKELRENEHNFKKIVELSPNGIIVFTEGKIVFVNKKCKEIIKAETKEELLDKEINDIINIEPSLSKQIDNLLNQNTVEVSIKKQTLLCLDNNKIEKDISFKYFIYQEKPSILTFIKD